MTSKDSDHFHSRRQMIGMLGGGMAAAPVMLASGGAFAQERPLPAAGTAAGQAEAAPVRVRMQDPRSPLYVLLASQEGSYTTGNVLSSTGGAGDV